MRLRVVRGELAGQVFAVDAPVVIVGRASECDLILAAYGISRRHARLRRVPQGWELTDLGSTNGTLVNGRPARAHEAILLRQGDRVTMSTLEFVIQEIGASDAPGIGEQSQAPQFHPVLPGPGVKVSVGAAPTLPDALIDLRQVVKVYETPAGPFTALKGIDLQVMAGEFVAVIGKSGSGKTTLINTITGIDRPTLGEVFVGEVPIHTLNENEMALWRGRNLGVIFQFFQLLPTLTLIENVMLPMEFGRLYSPRQRKERALYLLELVNIEDQAYKLPATVSGGQQQRAAIARALANDPIVLVADEPTGSLDSKTADSIFQLFENLTDQGKTILMVTHDQDLSARVSRVVEMADGQIIDQRMDRALDTLSQQQVTQISTRLEPVTYRAGSIIYRQGDVADRFYIIIKGQVQVNAEHPSGAEITVAVLGKGQYFGGTGLLEGKLRTATVRTEADAVLMVLDRDTFRQLALDSHLTPDIIAQLMRVGVTAEHLFIARPEQAQKDTMRMRLGHERITYQPGEIIFQEGDVADKFYYLASGEVEVLQSGHGKELVARLSTGQSFGEIGLLRGARRMVTTRAATDGEAVVEVVAIPRELYSELMVESGMTTEEIVLILRQRLMGDYA
jgi:ABC-type lipoprotein export system ATPase subunit/CRP-like cAMP-binding protein